VSTATRRNENPSTGLGRTNQATQRIILSDVDRRPHISKMERIHPYNKVWTFLLTFVPLVRHSSGWERLLCISSFFGKAKNSL
uniref:Uncharacterized protein n=1 Tax=Xiphophorus couchianus TaxID=32473 RepID=A0A3B5LCB3_9TELE